MIKTLLHFLLSITLVFLFMLPSYAVTLDKYQRVDEAVITELRKQHVVGVAIGIIQNNKVVYTKGYGFSQLKTRRAVTNDTVFNWASNSKPVIAIAAMQLVQNGILDLDKPIGAYIPSLPVHLKKITTRHLLSHQSGIPHYRNGKVIASAKRISPLKDIDPFISLNRFIMSPLIFEPGTRTEYSSYAYILLTAIVQAVGNRPIDQQLSTRIEKPIGLKSFQLDMPFMDQHNWTDAYKIRNGKVQKITDYPHFWKHGAGGYKSDVKDFSRFALALMNKELISTTTTTTMWTPQKLNNGRSSTYGLGVRVSGRGRNLKVSHNGSQDETRTRMVLYPNQQHGVVVMCNTQGCKPGKISTAIYSALSKR